nr:peroxisome biogenesis protein 2 [Ipomoea batatas]
MSVCTIYVFRMPNWKSIEFKKEMGLLEVNNMGYFSWQKPWISITTMPVLFIGLYLLRYRSLIERALRARLVYGNPNMN